MRVLFVDVGQGTCQMILTGNRRAIVIDAGISPDTALRTLRLFRIETIELLVVSHSHSDHSGGVASPHKHRLQADRITGILVDYHDAIDRIAFVHDSQFKKRPVGRYLVKLLKEKRLKKEQLIHIVACEKPHALWHSQDGMTTLAAISPLGGDHLLAFDGDNPNASSAILELRHRGDKVVFAADSEFDQWRDVHRLRGTTTCKALTMPHHGGLMQGTSTDLQWFCNEAVHAEVVVVSVATTNRHGHPREEVIRAVAASGSNVMCTQISEKCCADLEALRPGVVGAPRFPCRSSSRRDVTATARKSRNVACAGTVSALLDDQGIEIERRDRHRIGVDQLVARGDSPLCRTS